MEDNDKLTLSVRQAAARLQISRNLTYELIRQKQIPAIHLGKRILIPVAALEELLEKARNSIK